MCTKLVTLQRYQLKKWGMTTIFIRKCTTATIKQSKLTSIYNQLHSQTYQPNKKLGHFKIFIKNNKIALKNNTR